MRAQFRWLVLAALATLSLCTIASAQGRSQAFAQGNGLLLGPQIGLSTNSYDFFIGAQFAYPIVDRFDIYPSFQYYFPGGGVHPWTLDGSVRYWPKLNIKDSGLYAGAGLNMTHASGSTDAGLSLFGGWQFKTSNILPFAQVRFIIGNADRVDFGGGVNFRL